MSAFIFPNRPRTAEEKEAFSNAVYFQYEHEATKAMDAQNIPEGVESFRLGDFSMTFDKAFLTSRLTVNTICPSAYGALLRCGLLYRGVEGRP